MGDMVSTGPSPFASTASKIGNAARKVASSLGPLRDAANNNVRAANQRSSDSSPDHGAAAASQAVSNLRVLGSMKKGGRVKRTGLYRLHAGEVVKPVRKAGRGARGR